MSQSYTIAVSPDRYVSELQVQINGHIARLRTVLQAVEDDTFIARSSAPRSDDTVQLVVSVEDSARSRLSTVVAACNGCLLDMTRSLVEYVDHMIALQRLTRTPITVPPGGWTQQEAVETIRSMLDAEYGIVASDTRLTNPKKIDCFPNMASSARNAALAYFQVRRCLEHHGGVPREDLRLPLLRPTLYADEKRIGLPFIANAGTTIGVKLEPDEIVLLHGRRIALSESDIEGVFYGIQLSVAPEVRRTFG